MRWRGHSCRVVSAHLGGASDRRIKSPLCRGFSSPLQRLPTLATPVIRCAECHPAATSATEKGSECWQAEGNGAGSGGCNTSVLRAPNAKAEALTLRPALPFPVHQSGSWPIVAAIRARGQHGHPRRCLRQRCLRELHCHAQARTDRPAMPADGRCHATRCVLAPQGVLQPAPAPLSASLPQPDRAQIQPCRSGGRNWPLHKQ